MYSTAPDEFQKWYDAWVGFCLILHETMPLFVPEDVGVMRWQEVELIPEEEASAPSAADRLLEKLGYTLPLPPPLRPRTGLVIDPRAEDWRERAKDYAGVLSLLEQLIQTAEDPVVPIYLGDGRVALGNRTERFTAVTEMRFIEYLLDHGGKALTGDLFRAHISNPSEIAKKVAEKFEGFLNPFLKRPGGKKTKATNCQ